MKKGKTYLPILLVVLLIISCMMPNAAYALEERLIVDSSKSAAELAQILVGDGVKISNVKYTGHDKAKGTFGGGAEIIGFEEGIILSSGDVKNVVGPNKDHGISSDFHTPGDADLSRLIDGVKTNDAAVLEFDFIPESSVIFFTYVFASEEYNEYVNEFNDVFAFLLNGENVAFIPGTKTPVSINSLNGGKPYGEDSSNSQYYRNNELTKKGDGGLINTEMDGLTTVMQVKADVICGQVNHIKLAVADARDCSLDSAVFFKAGSFVDKAPSPDVMELVEGTIIGRMEGYIALSKPSEIIQEENQIELSYDVALLKKNSNHTPRIYYWNSDKNNWVALATYPVKNGIVKALNDGKYKGWFVVFGVIQPEFLDVRKNWAEQITNRMNGLGMVEGYPTEGKSLLRTANLEQDVSHAEFTMLISRILNIDIDDPRLPLLSKEESQVLLHTRFIDGNEIPEWVLPAAGTLCKEDILTGESLEFEACTPITRVEAAVMISKALNLLTECEEADLSKFTDSSEIPDWAKEELVEGVMAGYPDGTFKADSHLTRGESLTLLYGLFVKGLGW